jgi:phosphoglycolate phosphatase
METVMGPLGHIIFDHDGTLVNTEGVSFSLFEGMRELLSDLKTEGFELYVWTSRPRISALESLKHFEIIHFFTDFYCYGDGPSKPHPMGLNQLVGGVPKNKILHIGDSYSDIEGAQIFEIDVVLACWAQSNQVMILKENHLTELSAMNLSELRDIIKRKFYV